MALPAGVSAARGKRARLASEAAAATTPPGEQPAFPCLATPSQWTFWCPYCRRWHYHGIGPGLRAAHCHAGPYSDAGGYHLVLLDDRQTR